MSFKEFGPKVRVEKGPVRTTAVATPELLSDKVTAPHYKAGIKEVVKGKDGKAVEVPYRDAMGKPIVEGQEMAYLDYLGEHVWYVYALKSAAVGYELVPNPDGPPTVKEQIQERFFPDSFFTTEADAEARAVTLAAEMEG